MAEPVTTSMAIKGGAMIATGGLLAEMAIFTDGHYLYLAVVGSIVSTFGVLHELLKNRPIEHTMAQIIAELSKGLMLGVMAIPFWYLTLSEGGESILKKLFSINVGSVGNSVWLMISFAMSWYTVPIFDWFVSKVRRKAEDV